jgi:hypothetical protein
MQEIIHTLDITPDKINLMDAIDPMEQMITGLPVPSLDSPEALLNSGFDLPPKLRKLLKKKIHKQRMEDFRNGKLKKGTQDA